MGMDKDGMVATADRLIGLNEVERMVGIKKSLIYRLIVTGEFPRGRIVGRRARRWRASEIQAWVHA